MLVKTTKLLDYKHKSVLSYLILSYLSHDLIIKTVDLFVVKNPLFNYKESECRTKSYSANK